MTRRPCPPSTTNGCPGVWLSSRVSGLPVCVSQASIIAGSDLPAARRKPRCAANKAAARRLARRTVRLWSSRTIARSVASANPSRRTTISASWLRNSAFRCAWARCGRTRSSTCRSRSEKFRRPRLKARPITSGGGDGRATAS